MTQIQSNSSAAPIFDTVKQAENHSKLPATVVVYRGVFSEWGWLLLTIVLAAGAYHATPVSPWSVQEVVLNQGSPRALSINLPLLALLPILSGLKYLHSLFDQRYIICPDYVMEIRGILGWKRHSTRVNYVHIRGIEIDESLVEQMLGIGELRILTGPTSSDEYAICMDGIANPRGVKDIIQARTNIKLREFHGGGVEE